MAVAAQAGHNAGFLARAELGENVGFFNGGFQGRIVHPFYFCAQQNVFARQPHLTAYAAGNGIVVACQHLYAYAMLVERGQRL